MVQLKSMLPVEEVITEKVEYASIKVGAPKSSGLGLTLFSWLVETPFLGDMILAYFMHLNGFPQVLEHVSIPDAPMFLPEYPSEMKDEIAVRTFEECAEPTARAAIAAECLPPFRSKLGSTGNGYPFSFWTIRDYAEAYRSGHTTPTEVAERFIESVEESQRKTPPMSFFLSFDKTNVREQAAASTKRFSLGNPLSILDGIFVSVKDDIDCLPHETKGGTQWLHEVRDVKEDAVCVSRLRQCGVVFAGKTNMHELGIGTTGSNPLFGIARNPYDVTRYAGGSSAGSAAVVASGLCPAALGTDAGGSIRIPAALCGVVGLKSTFGRTTLSGLVPVSCTVESVGPIAATVEDAMIMYAAMLGSVATEILSSRPPPPCLPCLHDDLEMELQGLKLGKFTDWFYDVSSTEIPRVCDNTLDSLIRIYKTHVVEIVLPELEQLRTGHVVTTGSEMCSFLDSIYKYGRKRTSFESRATIAFFKQFQSSLYVSAQRLRRRLMFYHMETFKKVDVIVTPTTGITAPTIPHDPSRTGETDLTTNGNLMQFVMGGNFLGLPCITVPVGYDSSGLPIGLQLMARPWQEATLLRVASAIEKICTTSRREPVIFYNMLCA